MLEDIFRKTGIRRHIESALPRIKVHDIDRELTFTDYARERDRVTNALQLEGKVRRLSLQEYETPEERYRALVQTIIALPEDQLLIIPYDAGLFPSIPSHKAIKKGRLVRARRWESIPEPDRPGVTAESLVKDAIKGVRIGDEYYGYDWQGARRSSQEFRVTTLIDCIKGCILDERLPETDVSVRDYADAQMTSETGGSVTVKVPSLSEEVVPIYPEFRLSGIAVDNPNGKKLDIKRTSFGLSTTHTCPKKIYFIKYGRHFMGDSVPERTGDEIYFDFHDILGYKRAKKHINRQNKPYKIKHDPFLEPDQTTRDFFWKLHHNVIQERLLERLRGEETHDPYETAAYERAPLTDDRIELLLWKLVGYRNEERSARGGNAHPLEIEVLNEVLEAEQSLPVSARLWTKAIEAYLLDSGYESKGFSEITGTSQTKTYSRLYTKGERRLEVAVLPGMKLPAVIDRGNQKKEAETEFPGVTGSGYGTLLIPHSRVVPYIKMMLEDSVHSGAAESVKAERVEINAGIITGKGTRWSQHMYKRLFDDPCLKADAVIEGSPDEASAFSERYFQGKPRIRKNSLLKELDFAQVEYLLESVRLWNKQPGHSLKVIINRPYAHPTHK